MAMDLQSHGSHEVDVEGAETDRSVLAAEKIFESDQENTGTEAEEGNGSGSMDSKSDGDIEISVLPGGAGVSEGGYEQDMEFERLGSDENEINCHWEDVIGLNGFLIGKDPKEISRGEMERLQFSSSNEAFEFYKAYAHVMGFSVRRGSSRVDKESRAVVVKKFSCNKAGARMAKWMKRCRMKTTSRCEGYNSYVKKFIKREGTLVEFLQSVENVVKAMRERETKEEFYSLQTKPLARTEVKALKENAGNVFSRKSFDRFRKELRREAAFFLKGAPSVMVSDEGKIKCECKLLEIDGIPCRHAIHVMKIENLSKIPKSCIKKRWTKNVKDFAAAEELFGSVDEKAIEALRRPSLQMMCGTICYMGSKSKRAFIKKRDKITRLIQAMAVEPNEATREDGPQTEESWPQKNLLSLAGTQNSSACRVSGDKYGGSDSEYNTSYDELCTGRRSWAGSSNVRDEEALDGEIDWSDSEEENEEEINIGTSKQSTSKGIFILESRQI
ncbi:hypothetical protein COLO4_10395 [Corchorus olitorius]|uniref:Protein FAR1-RELATED SEQUENCE n=1 Tax=Corchorus olitorius TaxID=93759 RepID=A0A1R3K8Q6_9ROSI|nr:hypothetical protein COLO4_10395 [Corchorus olitorius]